MDVFLQMFTLFFLFFLFWRLLVDHIWRWRLLNYIWRVDSRFFYFILIFFYFFIYLFIYLFWLNESAINLKLMTLPSCSTNTIQVHDAPFLVKQSANCFYLLIQQMLISPLSCCSLIADISTCSLWSATGVVVFTLSCSDLLSIYVKGKVTIVNELFV